jgi:D-alanyl-lipoteichoic acid acyltransferase DltB (MBOAT superfamily)
VLFPTIQFGLFFPIVFLISWLLRPHPTAWKLAMLAAGGVFYYVGSEQAKIPDDLHLRYTLLLFCVAAVNWVFGSLIHQTRGTPAQRWLLGLAVVANIVCLAYFKYYLLLRDSVGWFFPDADNPLPAWRPILPIAISFFIFQAISYVVDIAKGIFRPASLLDFVTYLSFFPHVVAGPIVRAREFIPPLREPADPRGIDAAKAFRLILAGMFKKVVVSSYLLEAVVQPVFNAPQDHGSVDVLLGLYGYAVLIYCDFSGYTDIAIGAAELLGIRFPPNFDSPYRAVTLQDFWRRWHMTLSRWLRDYLYVPLGGNRKGEVRTYVNLMLTMVIGGLWHGASWTFVVWGAIHGGWLAGERYFMQRRRAAGLTEGPATAIGAVVWWLVTFNVVCVAWTFFNARTFTLAADVLLQLFDFSTPSTLVTPLLVVTIAGMIAIQFIPHDWVIAAQARFSYYPLMLQALVLAAGLWVVDALGPSGVAPFIYFQF